MSINLTDSDYPHCYDAQVESVTKILNHYCLTMTITNLYLDLLIDALKRYPQLRIDKALDNAIESHAPIIATWVAQPLDLHTTKDVNE